MGEISDKVKKEYLFPALQNSKYLLVLLNDILDFTQEEFNKEPRLVFETVNVKDIIKIKKISINETKVWADLDNTRHANETDGFN